MEKITSPLNILNMIKVIYRKRKREHKLNKLGYFALSPGFMFRL